MSEDDLLILFEKLNIQTGKLSPRVIKAWFDTDCDHLLQWMCSSITEDCHMCVQLESEYSQLDNVLSPEQLNRKVMVLETEYPDLFEVDQNVFDIEIAKDTVEMLEDDIKDCDHQLQVNEQLNRSLLAEFSKISAEEIQSQLEEETAQENCMKLSQELEDINKQTFEQVQKYSCYLSNYEFAEIPVFINNVDNREYEEKFTNISNNLNSITNMENDELEISSVKHASEVLSELKNRIFHSRMGQLALQMEIEALKSSLNFLESYNIDTLVSFMNYDSVLMSIGRNKEQQTFMLKVIEETSSKLAEQAVNQPTLRCLRSGLDFANQKLNFLNKFKESLVNILVHFVTVRGLYLLEKTDINNSSQFFKNINKYINKDLQESQFRKGAMLQLISNFEDFCLAPIENKFNLVGDFRTVLAIKNSASLREVLDRTSLLRLSVEKMRKQHSRSFIKRMNMLQETRKNINVLRDFLTCGPTCQLVTIPISLQQLLFEVNQNLIDQNSSIKTLVQVAQKPKERFSKDKWLRYQNQLWMNFMTDSTKVLALLEQIKNENHCEEKDKQPFEK